MSKSGLLNYYYLPITITSYIQTAYYITITITSYI